MSTFTKHDETTAPEDASSVLAMIKERYGFVPNLAAFVAESPAALGAILNLTEAFDKTSLSPQERQIVLLTVSALNDCNYCKTVHIALGKKEQIDEDTIQKIVAFKPLKDKKQNTLRDFTQSLVEQKGKLHDTKIQSFIDAGYTQAQVFEVILGVTLKTMTNYSNHLAGAEANEEFVSMAKA